MRDKLHSELKFALVNKDSERVSTIRLILAGIQDKDISVRSKNNNQPISDTEISFLLMKMIKQRKESIELYTKGGRDDLIKKEEQEIVIIESFLPKLMDDEEIKNACAEAIKLSQASSIKDMGKIMSLLKEKYSGKMDFSKASSLVKALLQG